MKFGRRTGTGTAAAVRPFGRDLPFVFLDLAEEALTFAAAFFFICLLFRETTPAGPIHRAVEITKPRPGAGCLYAERLGRVKRSTAGAAKRKARPSRALLTRSASVRRLEELLLEAVRSLKVNVLVVRVHDALADLRCALAFLALLIGVERLFQADAAVRAVDRFKAGAQAGVPVALIAMAVAGLLVDGFVCLGRHGVHILQSSRLHGRQIAR